MLKEEDGDQSLRHPVQLVETKREVSELFWSRRWTELREGQLQQRVLVLKRFNVRGCKEVLFPDEDEAMQEPGGQEPVR